MTDACCSRLPPESVPVKIRRHMDALRVARGTVARPCPVGSIPAASSITLQHRCARWRPQADLRHCCGKAWTFRTRPQRATTQAVAAGRDRQKIKEAKQWKDSCRRHRITILSSLPTCDMMTDFQQRQSCCTERSARWQAAKDTALRGIF